MDKKDWDVRKPDGAPLSQRGVRMKQDHSEMQQRPLRGISLQSDVLNLLYLVREADQNDLIRIALLILQQGKRAPNPNCGTVWTDVSFLEDKTFSLA